jgi:hypothetical protein
MAGPRGISGVSAVKVVKSYEESIISSFSLNFITQSENYWRLSKLEGPLF